MLYFNSNNEFDIRAFSLLGVSAKNSADAIGRFGTGLKNATAIILREGGEISVRVGETRYSFTLHDDTFRGKAITLIRMNGVDLPFSTNYGQNWSRWMALRELYANTVDEVGTVDDHDTNEAVCISVSGFDKEWATREEWLLTPDSPPIYSCSSFDLYHGESNGLYYQNFRVHKTSDTLPWKINLKGYVYLTEERSLGSPRETFARVERIIATETDVPVPVLNAAVTYDFDWSNVSHTSVSPAFITAAASPHATPNAKLLARRAASSSFYEPLPFDEEETLLLRSLFPHIRKIWLSAEISEVKKAILPDGVLGCYVSTEEQIYISPELLLERRQTILLCLIEEFLHKREGYDDYSRQFQTFVLTQLAKSLLTSK